MRKRDPISAVIYCIVSAAVARLLFQGLAEGLYPGIGKGIGVYAGRATVTGSSPVSFSVCPAPVMVARSFSAERPNFFSMVLETKF